MTYLEELLVTACDQLFSISVQPQLSRPGEQFGDFASNVALQLAKELGQPPRQVAEQLKDYLDANKDSSIAKIEIAGPGFLNFSFNDVTLWQTASAKFKKSMTGQKVLLEYSNPNAFKELHTGHLYQTIVGDSIGRLLEASGAEVYRANFGGDVGLHVARCMWGILQKLGGPELTKLTTVSPEDQAAWISQAYVAGAKADQEGSTAAAEIKQLNQAVYGFHTNDDHESPLAQIYWQCRDWSYSYFKRFYEDLEVAPFDKFYPESTTTEAGLALVKANLGSVFTESQGAVVFKGEEYGVHTRVFITSAGLPTYETKDLGVIASENTDFDYTKRVVMTGNDQSEYMRVVFAALMQFDEALAAKQMHITNGTVRFGDGQKMSSRLGNVTRAAEVIEVVQKAVEADNPALRRQISLGAIKYAFLKQRLGGDIAFDVHESVSLQGNSGPYLQYAQARAQSILKKAVALSDLQNPEFTDGERSLVRKLSEHNSVVEQAVSDLAPHLITTYLYELAQVFNRFYENNRVIGDDRQDLRLTLVSKYAATLKSGLELLNIPAPDKI
ncbi:MAG: arginine--tRNA ligase [Candidatus Saccharimonadales bacterium]